MIFVSGLCLQMSAYEGLFVNLCGVHTLHFLHFSVLNDIASDISY